MDNSNITRPIEVMQANFRAAYAKVPIIAGNTVVNFSLDNFRRQGFMGNSFQPWKPRKVINKWGIKTKNNGRAILILNGKMRRSTNVALATLELIIVRNSMPYAKAHNDGLRMGQIQQVKEYTRKITTVAKVTSLNTRKTASKKVTASTISVKAHTRHIDQNIPARPFLKDSPYLRRDLQKNIAALILKALK